MSFFHRHKIGLVQLSFRQFYIESMGSTELTIENGLENPGSALTELTDERNTLLAGALTMLSQSPPVLKKKTNSLLCLTGGLGFSKWLDLGREINGSRNPIMGFSQTLMEEAPFDLLQWLLIWKKTLW